MAGMIPATKPTRQRIPKDRNIENPEMCFFIATPAKFLAPPPGLSPPPFKRLAWSRRAKGPIHTSLGQRPRLAEFRLWER